MDLRNKIKCQCASENGEAIICYYESGLLSHCYAHMRAMNKIMKERVERMYWYYVKYPGYCSEPHETSKEKQTVTDGEADSCCLYARRTKTKSYSFNFLLHSIISSCTSKTLTTESVLSSSDLLYKTSHSMCKTTLTLFNMFTLLHPH